MKGYAGLARSGYGGRRLRYLCGVKVWKRVKGREPG
jgi:hypothetical protein